MALRKSSKKRASKKVKDITEPEATAPVKSEPTPSKISEATPPVVDQPVAETPPPSPSFSTPTPSPIPQPKPQATIPPKPGISNPILADKDKRLVNARVLEHVNAVIGKRRYRLDVGKTYKLSENVYDVLKKAGKVL